MPTFEQQYVQWVQRTLNRELDAELVTLTAVVGDAAVKRADLLRVGRSGLGLLLDHRLELGRRRRCDGGSLAAARDEEDKGGDGREVFHVRRR